jgi:hypothetical protein
MNFLKRRALDGVRWRSQTLPEGADAFPVASQMRAAGGHPCHEGPQTPRLSSDWRSGYPPLRVAGNGERGGPSMTRKEGVEALYLYGLRLTQAPAGLGQLSRLRRLYLQKYNVTQLPAELGGAAPVRDAESVRQLADESPRGTWSTRPFERARTAPQQADQPPGGARATPSMREA